MAEYRDGALSAYDLEVAAVRFLRLRRQSARMPNSNSSPTTPPTTPPTIAPVWLGPLSSVFANDPPGNAFADSKAAFTSSRASLA